MNNRIRKFISNLKFKVNRCSVCNNSVQKYNPLPKKYAENSIKNGYKYFGHNEHLNIHQYSCPICKATDRDRFMAIYLKDFLINKDLKKKLLHIAPSWPLNNRFLLNYYDVTTTDLMMKGVDLYQDIEKMEDIRDNSYDIVICSHVLEHVKNPNKALSEIYRVLKYNGQALLLAPIIPSLKNTIEDYNHITPESRLKHYGQEDHLRLFSKKDFMDRIVSSKFKLSCINIEHIGKKKFQSLGLRESSVLYVGIKE